MAIPIPSASSLSSPGRSRAAATSATGITSAARWVAENLPVFALDLVLVSAGELWALRYPETHGLTSWIARPGGRVAPATWSTASACGSVRVRSGDLASRPAVVVASEAMDEDTGWRALAGGELLHVDPDLQTTVTRVGRNRRHTS